MGQTWVLTYPHNSPLYHQHSTALGMSATLELYGEGGQMIARSAGNKQQWLMKPHPDLHYGLQWAVTASVQSLL